MDIFREPRREITESALGVAAFGGFLFCDSYFANWFHIATGGDGRGCPTPLAYIIGIIALVLLIFFLIFTHFIGETICDALASRGLELRPKRRSN